MLILNVMQLCHALKVIGKHAESEQTRKAGLVSEFCLQFYCCDDDHLGPGDPLECHVFAGVTWEMQFKTLYLRLGTQ